MLILKKVASLASKNFVQHNKTRDPQVTSRYKQNAYAVSLYTNIYCSF